MDAQSGWLHTAIVFHNRGTAEGGHGVGTRRRRRRSSSSRGGLKRRKRTKVIKRIKNKIKRRGKSQKAKSCQCYKY